MAKKMKFYVFTQFPVLGGNLTLNEKLTFSLNENIVTGWLGQNAVLYVAYLKINENASSVSNQFAFS